MCQVSLGTRCLMRQPADNVDIGVIGDDSKVVYSHQPILPLAELRDRAEKVGLPIPQMMLARLADRPLVTWDSECMLRPSTNSSVRHELAVIGVCSNVSGTLQYNIFEKKADAPVLFMHDFVNYLREESSKQYKQLCREFRPYLRRIDSCIQSKTSDMERNAIKNYKYYVYEVMRRMPVIAYNSKSYDLFVGSYSGLLHTLMSHYQSNSVKRKGQRPASIKVLKKGPQYLSLITDGKCSLSEKKKLF